MTLYLTECVKEVAVALDRAEMIRFEESTGRMASTDRGRTASLYYINYATADLVREVLHPLMLMQDLLSLIARAKEFSQMKVTNQKWWGLLSFLRRLIIRHLVVFCLILHQSLPPHSSTFD